MKNLAVEIIPLIQEVPPLAKCQKKKSNSLLFIGNFHHHPNVDAMLYFSQEILPLVKHQVPDIQLTIVGNSPPEEVTKLACDNVKVLGFVPDIRPLLEASSISIAPLRYGGGIKGKICEAMAYGLPVVTTSVGTEGFGLSPGENVLVGDTPQVFADAVAELLRNRQLYEKVRGAAWSFVNERYSIVAATEMIRQLVGRINDFPVKRLSTATLVRKAVGYHLDRHLFWRLKQVKG